MGWVVRGRQMELEKKKTYLPSFLKKCLDITNGSLIRVITNKEIDSVFNGLSKENICLLLEYFEQEGYIQTKSKIPFIGKNIIKSFVITNKTLETINNNS